MSSEQEARDVGEQIKKLLMRLVLEHGIGLKPIEQAESRRAESARIAEAIALVQTQIRPQPQYEGFLLAEGRRAERGFATEFQRLWARVLDFYIDARDDLHPELALLKLPANAHLRHQLRHDLRAYAKNSVVPALMEHPSAGEDLYLLVYHWILDNDPDASIDSIAQTGVTAAQWMPALYGMLGLLLNARDAHNKGDVAVAYTYLMDANHLIGMHEGSRYALKHSQAIERKLSAKASNRLSQTAKAAIKDHAVNLFYSMRKLDKDGKPIPWRFGTVAATEVYRVLVDEAVARNRLDPKAKDTPGISFELLKTTFARLVKLEKQGISADIRVEVHKVPPGAA